MEDFFAFQSKSTCHFQNENSKCFRVPYSIWGAKKQEIFSELLPVKRTEKKYKIFPASS